MANNNTDMMNRLRMHQECWDLIPWMVNGRLSATDATRVANHIDECTRCSEELQFQTRLRDAIRRDDSVLLAPQASLQKLMQRFDNPNIDYDATSEAPSYKSSSNEMNSLQTEAVRTNRWMMIAMMMQSLVIVGLLVAVQQINPNKHTVADEKKSVPVPPATQPSIRIKFKEETQVREVNRLLRLVDARMVSGPSEVEGVYTIEMSAATEVPAIDSVARQLDKDPHVLFAARILPK